MWPKVSRALSVISKSRKDSGIASAPVVPTEELQGNLNIKLPSFKRTFTSVLSYTEKEEVQELHDYQTQPKEEYAILPEHIAIPRSDAARELSRIPAAGFGATRDDLEKGNSRNYFAETM